MIKELLTDLQEAERYIRFQWEIIDRLSDENMKYRMATRGKVGVSALLRGGPVGADEEPRRG